MTKTAIELARIRELARNGTARRIREQAGLSRREMAESLGIHETTVQKWENGTRAPHGERALRFANLLRELAEVGL